MQRFSTFNGNAKKYIKIHKGTFLEIALKDTHLVDLRLIKMSLNDLQHRRGI